MNARIFVILAVFSAFAGCANPGSSGTPEAQDHNGRGVDLMDKQGKYEEAKLQFDLALTRDPEFMLAKANRGLCLHKLGRSTDGIKDCKEAIEREPDLADSYNNLGEIYFDLSRDKDAEETWNEGLD